MHTNDYLGLYEKGVIIFMAICRYAYAVETNDKLPEEESKWFRNKNMKWAIPEKTNFKRRIDCSGFVSSTPFKDGYLKGIDDYDKGLTPVRIIYNPPATIVFWADGDKTVVKCSETETFNKYHGFCAALAKRVIGNNSQIMKIVESGYVEGKLPDRCDVVCEKPDKKKKSKETKKK
jgi:hypothetical protein